MIYTVVHCLLFWHSCPISFANAKVYLCQWQYSPLIKVILIAAFVAYALQPTHASSVIPGINYAGAEFGNRDGRLNTHYTYPSAQHLKYFFDKGFKTVRLPFKWQRVQPQLHSALSSSELAQIRAVVTASSAASAYVILDPHNYARYDGVLVGTTQVPAAAFVDLWERLAKEFAASPNVIFGLMNEPHGLSAQSWKGFAQDAVNAIRSTGAKNLILVPGVAWTGAHSWEKSGNASAFAGFRDPGNNFAIEVHQYLDSDFSGTKTPCPDVDAGVKALSKFGDWLETNKMRGYLGEFGASSETQCLEALDRMLAEVERRPNLWLGWAYWAAGHWWPDSYPMSIQPKKDGSERPQMKILEKYVK